MAILHEPEDVRNVLRESRNIAVLGADVREHRPAYYVPAYLADAGYAIYPVNPVHQGRILFGEPTLPTLASLEAAIDIVDVFRRSEHLPDHVDDILAMEPLPKAVWFQQGIRNDEVAEKLSAAGIDVIQDRCMLVDHQRLLATGE
ncbi:MAG TPA: CoA-binding protein [Trueperaceae bacterium]